ncbi:MAG: hypothetical protein KTR18_08260 [Acidiferrobacterales bacterium]|nr:hypothetical protein [Acidiferrobacterales bacterium]
MLETVSKELEEARGFESEMRKFSDVISQNAEIQETLTKAVDSGISRDGFRDLYVATAKENGCNFSASDMEVAMHEQKQGKDKVIPTVVQKLITVL